jgi:hypothetical protein
MQPLKHGTLFLTLVSLILLGTRIQVVWCVPPPSPPPREQVRVWVLPSSKIYHCPKSRWYGKGEEGKYMDECQALSEGFKPAFGVSCGSSCG